MSRTPILSIFVKKAAQKALDDINYHHVLPWVPKSAEQEIAAAFEQTLHERDKGGEAAVSADRSFFATVLHLSGIPPASPDSLPWKHPLSSLMENAVESGNMDDLKLFLLGAVDYELEHKFDQLKVHANFNSHDAVAARQYASSLSSFTQMVDAIFALVSPKEPTNEIQSLLSALKPKEANAPLTARS